LSSAEEIYILRRLWLVLCIFVLLCGAFALTTYGVLTTSKTVSSSGRISALNVGVYKESACTQTATSIDWGNLTTGQTANVTLYIKNTGAAKETLGLSVNSWSPTNSGQYITVTWNQSNTVLAPNQVVAASFTVNVSASISSSITTFSNKITITGTS
jgi:archaellum component FlaG (FlaF/FlaG flagellin family)